MENVSARTRSRKSLPVKNNNTVLAFKQKNAQRSRDSAASTGPRRNRNSTPVRKHLKRPRHDTSSLIELPEGSVRKFHPDYDPNIEIRQAKERYSLYKSKDWNVDFDLEEAAKKDLNNYQQKRLRKSLLEVDKEQFELEKKIGELRRRQKDVDLGKITEQYAKYVFEIPKPEREPFHPKTPNKFRKMSRRAWDGQVKKWRKHLHNYTDPEFSILYRSECSSISNASQSTEFSFTLEDELPECANDFKFEEVGSLMVPRDVIPEYDEEETLQGNTENIPPPTKKVYESKLPVELLHSGLTSDIDTFKMVNGGQENSVGLESPNKKPKRQVLGILAQHNKERVLVK